MMPAKMRDDVWKRKVAMDRQNGSSLASICVLERYKTWVRVMGKIGGSPGVVGRTGVIARRGGAVIVAGCGCGDRSSKPDGCFFSKLHIFLSRRKSKCFASFDSALSCPVDPIKPTQNFWCGLWGGHTLFPSRSPLGLSMCYGAFFDKQFWGCFSCGDVFEGSATSFYSERFLAQE